MLRVSCFLLIVFWSCFAWASSVGVQKDAHLDLNRFEKQVIVSAAIDPMQMDVLPDGRVLFIERHGPVKMYDPTSQKIVNLGKISVGFFVEVGLMGMALAPDFEESGLMYLFYCPLEKPECLRLSRFILQENRLRMDSEVVLLEYPIDVKEAVHMGGGLWMTAKGDLYIGTGDNTVPIPELPLDQRPGQEYRDAMRTSANTQDLRGKILRIHPESDGTYSIPAGNLFPDGVGGRPEIYAMGCRNAFRICVDDQTETLYWGDVGPNIFMEVDIGPSGYDEINRTKRAGNFGWPMFVGPNEAYQNYDFETGEVGARFDPLNPQNTSRNNTGAVHLPPAQGALIWYPSTNSTEFPQLGSGGRSAMAGLVYHAGLQPDHALKMPSWFEGKLFIHDWTRNWIKTVEFDDTGEVIDIQPFMEGSLFRKPMQITQRADGTLYIIEFGDKWINNLDAQIVRIVYRHGNRPPVVKLRHHPVGGKEPLQVKFDASESFDKDPGDELSFRWTINGRELPPSKETIVSHTFEQPGNYRVLLSAMDQHGLETTSEAVVTVGNAVPKVSILDPPHGGFFDWGQVLKYRLEVDDLEDGGTADHTIFIDRIAVKASYQPRRLAGESDAYLPPGLQLMKLTTCFSCHTTGSDSGGPSYQQVAKRYQADAKTKETLAKKIITGGSGAWGTKVMPPHPQHSIEETLMMVDWILNLATDRSVQVLGGYEGSFQALSKPIDHRAQGGMLMIEASYMDEGYKLAPPLTVTQSHLLHARRRFVAYFDELHEVETLEVFEGQEGMVAQFGSNSFAVLKDVNLSGIQYLKCRASAVSEIGGTVEFRLDRVDGPLLATLNLSPPQDTASKFTNYRLPISGPDALHDLFLVSREASSSESRVSISWVEFLKVITAETSPTKIVLIPVVDSLHDNDAQERRACEILAACVNHQPHCLGIVSPEPNWPTDHQVIADARAVVFCKSSGPGPAESSLSGNSLTEIEEQTAFLRSLGVGVVSIAMSSSDDEHATASTSNKHLQLVQAIGHEIFHGCDSSQMIGVESTLDLTPGRGDPLLEVIDEGNVYPAAWLEDATDRGRMVSFLGGALVENLREDAFRRITTQAILWAARESIPTRGVDVWLDPQLLPKSRRFLQKWTLEELAPYLKEIQRGSSYSNGKRLFSEATCAACHRINHQGGILGPDLTEVGLRMSKEPDPLLELLREIVEPSKVVHPDYEASLLVLSTGKTISGMIVSQDELTVQLVSDPSQPTGVHQISTKNIEDIFTSKTSLMPTGLLNSLEPSEILDLLAYVVSGGNRNHRVFVSQRAEEISQ